MILYYALEYKYFLGLAGVLRRYSDYPGSYTSWNIVSPIGSIISLVSIFVFMFIIWESMSLNRLVLFPNNMNSSIEWFQLLPPSEHSYSELPMLNS